VGEILRVSFVGPYSWPGASDAPSLFDADIRREAGIYLWTVRLPDGFLVYYVGETGRSLESRMFEHYKEHASCMYHLYDPKRFARGEKVPLWPGRFDTSDRRTILECIQQHGRLSTVVAELTSLYRFLFAPLAGDQRIRRRVEAAIAYALYDVPGIVGMFQDVGIRYSPRRDDEHPVECEVLSSVVVLGLPSRLSV